MNALFVVFLSGLTPARAIDFDGGVDAKGLLNLAKVEASRDLSQPAGSPVPIRADGGDGYELRDGAVWRVIDRYGGKLFPDRIGPLEGAYDVVTVASFQDRLLAVQKNGRVFVFCPTTARRGAWAIIGVETSGLEVRGSRLYAMDRAGQSYVYTGDLRSETDFGLRSSLVNGWLPPSAVFGNSIHNFKKVSGR